MSAIIEGEGWTIGSFWGVLEGDRGGRFLGGLGWEMRGILLNCILFELARKMSELQRRRRKYMIEIKRKANEEYFRARREILLREDEPEQGFQSLYRLVKLSMKTNGLSSQFSEAIIQLKQVLSRGEIKQKYAYLLAICSNTLLDDLKLQQKEAIISIMYDTYTFLSTNINNKAIEHISYSLVNFTNAIPCLHQEFADDCLHLLYSMIKDMLPVIIRWQPSDHATQITQSIIQSLTNSIIFQHEYISQLQVLFSHHITFFDELLKYHSYLLGDKNNTLHRIIRKGYLNVFEEITSHVVLNQHPIIFESQLFIDFVIREILEAGTSQWEKQGLTILTNLLIDYQETEFCQLLDGFDRVGYNCVEMVLKNLMTNDCNTFHRLKLLKTIISIKQVYNHLKPFFVEYWREIIDFCVDMLKSDKVEIIRFSALVLLILGEISTNRNAYIAYMINLGCQPLFQDLLLMIQEARSGQLQDLAEEVHNILSHMLFALQQFD